MLAKKNLHKVNQALIIWFTALFEHFFSNELIQWLVILKITHLKRLNVISKVVMMP